MESGIYIAFSLLFLIILSIVGDQYNKCIWKPKKLLKYNKTNPLKPEYLKENLEYWNKRKRNVITYGLLIHIAFGALAYGVLLLLSFRDGLLFSGLMTGIFLLLQLLVFGLKGRGGLPSRKPGEPIERFYG